ncbi:MAG: hypothetical protein V2A34_08770 [Lentisphaerota bacterium]
MEAIVQGLKAAVQILDVTKTEGRSTQPTIARSPEDLVDLSDWVEPTPVRNPSPLPLPDPQTQTRIKDRAVLYARKGPSLATSNPEQPPTARHVDLRA